MTLLPAEVIEAPEPRGLRYGLLTAANGPLVLEPHMEGGGIVYEPVSCGFARVYDINCDIPGAGLDFDENDPFVEAEPFLVYSSVTCGSAGKTTPEMETKVRRRLANGEQGAAEKALGAVLDTAGVGVTAPIPDDLDSVIGALEQWLYGDPDEGWMGYGNRGYLHVPIRLATHMDRLGLLRTDGPVYKTAVGTVVVLGAYPDDGIVHISGQVTLWRSADVDVPDPRQTFDRTSNQHFLVAQRGYAVAFDCLAAGAQFTGDLGPS